MTDNEIIKALECCKGEVVPCSECIYADFGQCQTYMADDALKLIKRKQAEIERLQDFNENLQTGNTALSNEILEIKSEAYKEFAERFRALFAEYSVYDTLRTYEILDRIDIVEEELTEGSK